MAKKRKFFIDIPKAVKFLNDAYGLTAFEVNYYHLKIVHDDFDGRFNWYHTQGTLVVEAEDYCANIGASGDEEEVAQIISEYVASKM